MAKANDSAHPLFNKKLDYPPMPRSLKAPAAARALAPAVKAVVNLEVPHIHQLWDTSDAFNGHWACGPTSATMVLAYYKLLGPKPIQTSGHTSQFGWYVSNRFVQNGYAFDPIAQTDGGFAAGIYGSTLDNHPGLGWVSGIGPTHHVPSPRAGGWRW